MKPLLVTFRIAAIATFAACVPLQAQRIQMPSGNSDSETDEAITAGALTAAAAGTGIPIANVTVSSTKDAKTYSLSVLGQNPFAAPATFGSTSIKVVIVPLIITIKDPTTSVTTTFDPTAASSCILGTNGNLSPVDALTQSPLFQNVTWDGSTAAGHGPLINGVNVGTGTYIDAFRRAEFWQVVGNTPYQTVFNVSTGPTVSIGANTVQNTLGGGTVSNDGCSIQGKITSGPNLQDYIKNTVIPSPSIANIDPTALIFFLSVNVNGGGFNGYHGHTVQAGSTSSRVYLFTQYNTAPISSRGDNRPGIVTATHELGEATDDPLASNSTPKWSQMQNATSCQAIWEVGDPLAGTNLTPILMPNGVTYYVQELAFFDWYFASGSTNSQGAGGLFSSGGTFQGPSHTCPPGGSYLGQTVTLTQPSNQAFSTQPVPLVATASSGLPVTLTSTTPAVCSVSNVAATILAPGTCSIQATQSGDADYAAAVPVTVSFTISRATQKITFTQPSDQVFGPQQVPLVATASSGLPVTLTSTTPGICAVANQGPGGQPTAALITVGSCSIKATQPGNVGYSAAAPVTRTFTISQAGQTINFGALPGKTYGDPPFTLSATATSGLPVAFASTTSTVCTVSASTVTLVKAGACTIQASQPGNPNYAAATPVLQSFTVAKAAQTITFGPLAGQPWNNPPFNLTATASSGLAVSYATTTSLSCTVSGNTVTMLAPGTCTIKASQAGNADYSAAAPVSQSFTVQKSAQTITFAPLGNKVFGDAPFAVTATASSGLAVSFASNTTAVCAVSAATVTLLKAGTCTITASQPGNTLFSAAAPVVQSFTIAKAAQTITFGALTNKTYGDAPFTVSATASSGLAVSFASTTTGVCTVSASTVTLVAGGTCTIQASQGGNNKYNPAPAVSQSFTVAKAAQTISFAALPNRHLSAGPFTVSATTTSGLAVSFSSKTATVCSVSGSTVSLLTTGTCTIKASQAGNQQYLAAPNVDQSFTVQSQ